jgi:hypothetical protein
VNEQSASPPGSSKTGNYGEFAVGDHAEFGLQFYLGEGLAPVRAGEKRQAIQVAEDLYHITASVVHVGNHGWVLDFGLLAYQDTAPPEGVAVGQVLAGRATLGVDPYSYFEQLAKDPRYPDMVYTWNVRSIGRDTALFVLHGKRGFVMRACEAGSTYRRRTRGLTTTATATTYSAVNCCRAFEAYECLRSVEPRERGGHRLQTRSHRHYVGDRRSPSPFGPHNA